MCDLCSPALTETKNFDQLVKLLSDHLEPQRSEIAERHVFRLRRQRPGEPLMDYLHNLKHLATTCNFGSTLEENLRDQFVSGLVNEVMRSRIFAERNIKFKEAVELALALEAAEKHAEVSGATSVPTTASCAGGEGAEALHQASDRRGPARRPSAVAGGGARARGRRDADEVRCWRYASASEDEDFFNIELAAKGNGPYFIKVIIDGHVLECEIDTGSRISAISDQLFNKLFPNKKINTDNLILRCYSGTQIKSLGYINVNVTLNEIKAENLALYVIENGSHPLVGRDWMRALNIKKITLKEIVEDNFIDCLINEFPEVFTNKLGTCKKTIQLHLTDKEPVYVRARPVPLALRGRVENELERLEREGYTYRVDHSEYGTPIVPVVKECGEIRICGDYKITINPKLKRDYYPLPRIEELFAALSGGEEFSKIELKHSYQQVLLSEESQPYTAITTHIGTFVYRRTPFGLSCIPEKFQKIMEETLRGVPGDKVLAHYEEGRPLVLSVDSSAYGLGAVLAHRYPDGSERPSKMRYPSNGCKSLAALGGAVIGLRIFGRICAFVREQSGRCVIPLTPAVRTPIIIACAVKLYQYNRR
ncbi:uncharacterized protein LOC126770705 [Nymphalis io]|uniref:uncharacterized protein LOC126770705 n=1 Tax=Inachis io TaxID=171585 RepID=UPI0021680BCE|nr:uncharacterized protein LOC126770705 [Nymphalis io]